MRAIVVERFMQPQELVVSDAPEPTAAPGSVVIDVRAAGANFFDGLMVEGKYQERPPFPFVPGSECAGVVHAVSDGVADLKPGDRVMSGLIRGAFAERVAVPASRVWKMPEGVSFETAAAFPVVYGTSYMALVERAHVRAGETVLVTAAAGGVGLAAVQIAKALGARVIGAAGTEEKRRAVRDAGADATVDYTQPEWHKKALEANGGTPIDVVIEIVGGDVFELAWKALAWSGRLVVVGFTSGGIPKLEMNRVLLKNAEVTGVFLGSYVKNDPKALQACELAVTKLLADGKLKPLVSATYPLEKTGEALVALGTRGTHGKVVITV